MGYTKEQAKTEISRLVNAFQANEARLRNQAEAQIENNFIRPLFKYLNWNTTNEGLAVADYEFVLNRTIRGGKRPDYTLQLDRQHLLVMDAKQVKYDMHDPRWLNQVYSYAYSTQSLSPARKIDFAILTDFEEFLVLDCTLHVNDPKALTNFLVLNWTYRHFVTQFDRLWELFERENMLQAARTRGTGKPQGIWALALSPAKAKANRIPPDKAFLSDMDDDQKGWRVRLAKDMKKHNSEADGGLITAAVQLLIDRLIFIKALSDREIEDDYLAELANTVEHSGMADSDTGWFAACREIFRKLDKFYNGSIFRPRPELEAVAVSNKVVRDIIRSMQPENSPYNFAVMPVEILGTIYERFLGRVVRATEKQVKIEEKPEVRKAGGVYYTPQYIVDYIVKQTVGELLEKCRTPEDAAKLKILDPACGSGSFLVGAYTALIDWHLRFYDGKARLTARDRGEAYHDSDGSIRLTARLKRRILLNNLFGVDIDPQAVEVTRFSLSLKALEDTRRDELTEERSLFKETVLPELSGNIKCGNSLIGPDYFSGRLMPDPQEMLRVNPFDWDREFREIMARGGFDAVIGNPPYVRQESLFGFKDYLATRYEAFNGVADLYAYFMEKGVKLLREGGLFSIIVSSSFLRATYGEPLRRTLKKHAAVRRIVDFGGLPVFASAKDTYVCIPLLAKGGKQWRVEVAKVDSMEIQNLSEYVAGNHFTIPSEQLSPEAWALRTDEEAAVFDKITKIGKPLGEYVKKRIFYGIKTGFNEAFEIDEKQRVMLIKDEPANKVLIKPFLGGQDIRRYFVEFEGRYLIVIPNGWTRKQMASSTESISSLSEHEAWIWLSRKYPSVAKHLALFADALKKRQDQGEFWWELRPCDYYEYLDAVKIIFPDICKNPRFYLDRTGIYLANTAYCLGTDDLYLLGVLNSRLFWFAISNISIPFGVRAGEFRYRLIYQYMEKVPIRSIDSSNPSDKARHDKMVKLVESMLALHKQKAAAKTQPERELYERQIEATDRQIDTLVYELYDLTPKEIAILEEGSASTAAKTK